MTSLNSTIITWTSLVVQTQWQSSEDKSMLLRSIRGVSYLLLKDMMWSSTRGSQLFLVKAIDFAHVLKQLVAVCLCFWWGTTRIVF